VRASSKQKSAHDSLIECGVSFAISLLIPKSLHQDQASQRVEKGFSKAEDRPLLCGRAMVPFISLLPDSHGPHSYQRSKGVAAGPMESLISPLLLLYPTPLNLLS